MVSLISGRVQWVAWWPRPPPLKRQVGTHPNTRYLGVWLYVEIGSCRCDQVKDLEMRPSWLSVGPRNGVLIREICHGGTEGGRPREDGGRDWSDVATSPGVPATSGARGEAGSGVSLGAPEGTGNQPTHQTPWFQTSDLQNCEGIRFCCFRPPTLQPWETNIAGGRYCAGFPFPALTSPS